MLTKTESLRILLSATPNCPAALHFAKYGTDVEWQINVSTKGGEPVDGKKSTYTDGINTWGDFRISSGFKDYKLSWPLDNYAQDIGTNGFDWKNQVSRHVGFDFDTIEGHAPGVGIPAEQLDQVIAKLSKLRYLKARRSTRGKGLHVEVEVDHPNVPDRAEHAAVGHAVLAKLSEVTGLPLVDYVDACGVVLWGWSTRATPNGFELLSPQTEPYPFPIDPRPFRNIGKSKRQTTLPEAGPADQFEALTRSSSRVELEPAHYELINTLTELGSVVWNKDLGLLQTHTVALSRAHERLNLRGFFQTNSLGTNLNEFNCFCFPLKDGGWRIVRYGPGTAEHASWTQDGKTWTHTTFNQLPHSIGQIAAHTGGVKIGENVNYSTLSQANKSAETMGVEVQPPPESMLNRPAKIAKVKGTYLVKFKASSDDPSAIDGWVRDGKDWVQPIDLPMSEPPIPTATLDAIRCLHSETGEPLGWAANEGGKWLGKGSGSVKSLILAHGTGGRHPDEVRGHLELHTWEVVSQPFTPEYPAPRVWNKGGAQLKVEPIVTDDDINHHPHWSMVLEHCGASITEDLRKCSWAKECGILTGGLYLQAWIASMIRYPRHHLPYLFLYGPENSGKSMFWEMQQKHLLTGGVEKADRSLTDKFNSELVGVVLAVVEEKSVNTPEVVEKLKDYVTGDKLSIRGMRTNVYSVPNYTHWVQTANKPHYCPVFPGDSRVTVLRVSELANEIPKDTLDKLLADEAPHFLHTLLTCQLPPIMGRLRVPVVETEDKSALQDDNSSLIERLVKDHFDFVPGSAVKLSDLVSKSPLLETRDALRQLRTIEGVKVGARSNNDYPIIGLKPKGNTPC